MVLRDTDLLERDYKDLTESCPDFSSKFSIQEVLRAAGIVSAYGAGQESILPYLDMANHDNNPNAELVQAEDEGVFALVATRKIREGEEITQSYFEEKADVTSLTRYGFIEA